jgi:hypothetical protein
MYYPSGYAKPYRKIKHFPGVLRKPHRLMVFLGTTSGLTRKHAVERKIPVSSSVLPRHTLNYSSFCRFSLIFGAKFEIKNHKMNYKGDFGKISLASLVVEAAVRRLSKDLVTLR